MLSETDDLPDRRNAASPVGLNDIHSPSVAEGNPAQNSSSPTGGHNVTSPEMPKADTSNYDDNAIYFRRYELLIEYASLRNPSVCPPGIYVMPALDNINIWYGVIFVHRGFYKGAVLKYRLDIPLAYPATAPIVTFITDTFHPLVDQKGRFAVEAKFPKWVAQSDHIVDLLRFLKASFKVGVLDSLTEESCLNKQAYRMYHNERHLFTRLSEQCARVSSADSVAFDDYPEGNTICFKPLSEAKFEEVFAQVTESAEATGLSSTKNMPTLEGVVSKIKKQAPS